MGDKTADRFEMTAEGIFRLVYVDKKWIPVQLANFSAEIINELIVTDGIAQHIEFEIKAVLGGKTYLLDVTAEEFERGDWPLRRIGAGAIVKAGYNTRDELREAIQ